MIPAEIGEVERERRGAWGEGRKASEGEREGGREERRRPCERVIKSTPAVNITYSCLITARGKKHMLLFFFISWNILQIPTLVKVINNVHQQTWVLQRCCSKRWGGSTPTVTQAAAAWGGDITPQASYDTFDPGETIRMLSVSADSSKKIFFF